MTPGLGSPALWRRVRRRWEGSNREEVAVGFGPVPWVVRGLVWMENTDPNPQVRFWVAEASVLQVLRAMDRCGMRPTLWIHTHPEAQPLPSDADLAAFAPGAELWPGCWMSVQTPTHVSWLRAHRGQWLMWSGPWNVFEAGGLERLRGMVLK